MDNPTTDFAVEMDDKSAEGEALSPAERAWLEENRDAIADYNAWIEANGLPLAELRLL